MSRPITIINVTIKRSETGAQPTKVDVRLSNNTSLEVLCGAYDSTESIIQQVANAVIEANQTAYWHPITAGLVEALIKFKRAVIAKNENSIHLLKDMDRTANELSRHSWNNFTKLRFHGLVAKDDVAGSGYWLLTRRGNQFLRGEILIPKRVKTENNVVIGHDELMVTIEEVFGSTPYFDTIATLEVERQVLPPIQAELSL